MQTTCSGNNSEINLKEKIFNFKKCLEKQSFILLARPNDVIYHSEIAKNKFVQDLNSIINKGLLILEIP